MQLETNVVITEDFNPNLIKNHTRFHFLIRQEKISISLAFCMHNERSGS